MKYFTLLLFCLFLIGSTGTLLAETPDAPVEFRVRGQVTDEAGEPLIGVNILEKENKNNGTVTDIDGFFQITVASENSTLLISYVSFEDREVPVNGQSQMEVILQESASLLNEVVVLGYGTQIKRDVTGAISTLKGEELQAFNVSSVDQQLQGLAAGVQVTSTSGVPGAPVRVMIRGTNSLFSGTEPLWIIDGMILSNQGGAELNGFARNAGTTPLNPLATLNPNDIESIEVLKDAAATAVYGSRGANGVILVTTKSGKKGRGTLDLSVNYGISDVVRGPNEIGFVDGPTWLALADEARTSRGLAEFDPNSILDNSRDPNAVLDRNQIANTNWADQVLRQGSITDINLSTSRGGENLNYFISANYREDESILVGDRQERVSLRANADFTPVKNLSVGTRINLSWLGRERAPNGGAPGGNSNLANPGYNAVNGGIVPILPIFHPTATNSAGQPILFDPLSGRNPLASLDRNNYINDVTTYRGLVGVNLDYKVPFVKGLSIRSELGADIINTSNLEWANTVIREDSKYGFDQSSTFQRFNYNVYASYNRTFADIHNLSLVFGTESTEQANRNRNIEAQQLFGAAQQVGSPGDIQRVSAFFGGELFFRGYFSRLNYKLNDKYLLGLSYRRDGSSIFTEDLRWGNFTALSAGWILSEEAFLKDNDAINFLKLRGSFGQTGNSSISATATETTYTGWGRYGDTGAGDLLTGIGNPAVTWETTDAFDVGVDFELYEGRISGTIGYYRQDVQDMLFRVPVPSSSGIWSNSPTVWDNIGDMRNEGFEFELSTVNINTKDFSWRTSFNFTTNQNQITRLVDEGSEIANINNNGLVSRVGDPIGFFRLARHAGIDPQGGYELIEEMDLENFASTGERVPTGNLIPATRANLQRHLFDNTDKTGLPTFFGGFNNSFSYKGFELSALFTFSGGNWIYDAAKASSLQVSGVRQFRQDLVGNYWTPDDNTDAEYAALSWNRRYDVINPDGTITENERFDNRRSGEVSDQFLTRGDFIRLRSLGLSYNLPKSVAKSLAMQNIRVGVLGNNLWTITGFDGYDPEVVNLGGAQSRNLGQGWVGVQLPQLQSWNFNINVTF